MLQVIQRRQDGTTNFYRSWSEYKKGFGSPDRNVWLGNYIIIISPHLFRDQDIVLGEKCRPNDISNNIVRLINAFTILIEITKRSMPFLELNLKL